MSQLHEANVESQFGPQADAYVRSAVHSAGEDLDALEEIAFREAPLRALDLGCGGGHVAYRLALHAVEVVASDLSPDMMAAVADTARRKGLTNISTQAAPAEKMPFANAAFDFLACRFSAHHWRDFEAGLREARRVVERGKTAVFIDVVSPGRPLLDTHLQTVELLRDISHVRDYAAAEWLDALSFSGFQARATQSWRVRMDFPDWIARMRTPKGNAQTIRAIQNAASKEVSEHFSIEPDGSFTLDVVMIETVVT